ncbi:hypothetical protein SCOR_16670 [Sulfidibacter corallicola]|uniref:Uncharacterized protein n=1 Tax=Sulfidibacter corallicola TaxID=2818388 RepID=A0A8A4TXT0_SULCO|nr:hypothetical protein [Sulfidibacter corallicola]QTD53904.1 hypothetical protein J3U87_15760 [Sulfidibacter corallicola]
MRPLWQGAFLVLLVIVVARTGPSLVRVWHRIETRVGGPIDFEGRRMGIGYVVGRDSGTEFAMPPGGPPLRILVNPTMEGEAPDPESPIPFGVAYTFLDVDRNPLFRDVYHFVGKRSLFRTDAGAQPFPASEFEDRGLHALDLRVALLVPQKGTEPAFVRFELVEPAGRLADLVLRVYTPNKLTPGTEMVAWQKMRVVERQRLARASIEDYRFLEEDEIIALVRSEWRPIGPTGIKNRDYQVRRVFTLRENPGQNLGSRETVGLDGFLIGPGRVAMVPLPEVSGRVRLAFEPWGDAPPEARGELRIELFRRQDTPHRWTLPVNRPEGTWQHVWAEGDRVLDISADRPVTLRVLFDPGSGLPAGGPDPPTKTGSQRMGGDAGLVPDESWDITPTPAVSPAWAATPDSPIRFSVMGGEAAVPFRLVAFSVAPSIEDPGAFDGPLPARQDVQVRVSNAAGESVMAYAFSFTPEPNVRDYLDPHGLGGSLSKPEPRHFHVPMGAHHIDITADPPALVTGSVRPAGLPAVRKVPRDYADYQGDGTPVPVWFPLDPDAAERLRQAHRMVPIHRQGEPPEPHPLLAAGDYWVEEYALEPRSTGLHLFLARELGPFFDARSGATAFTPIRADRLVEIVFMEDFAGMASPVLLFRKDDSVERFQIEVDGVARRDVTTSAPIGEVGLGAVRAGLHQLRVQGPSTETLLVSHVRPERTFWRKVYVSTLLDPMWVSVEKPGPEPIDLAIRVFAPFGAQEPTYIRTYLEAPHTIEGSRDYTLMLGHFELAPAPEAAPAHLGPPDLVLDEGTVFFLRLGEDLGPGSYRLRIEKESGPGSFIRVTRIADPRERPTRVTPVTGLRDRP